MWAKQRLERRLLEIMEKVSLMIALLFLALENRHGNFARGNRDETDHNSNDLNDWGIRDNFTPVGID